MPEVRAMEAPANTYDVAVIGAGVVGAAIARAISHYDVRTVLLEAASDVGARTSKANTAILHTGFDAVPGSLEARLIRRGRALMTAYAAEVGIAVEPTGAILVAWSDVELAALPGIQRRALENGVDDLQALSAADLYVREPHLGAGARGGVLIPGEAIICPYSPPLAFASEAVANGVTLKVDCPVGAVTEENGWHRLSCPGEELRCRLLVNAAGLAADAIDRMLGFARFTVTPRRGELIVFDKLARGLLSHVLLPVPTQSTKGVLVSPTVFGNVLLGPTAEDVADKTDTATSAAGLRALWGHGRRILPALMDEEVTAAYAGLRAATEHRDYQIHLDVACRYVCVGGIRSTGLSASLAIAEHVVELVRAAGIVLRPRATVQRVRMPPIGERQQRPFATPERIAADPDYGRIVCHCERVTRGELRDAMCAAVPARSLDGLRRRTRCLQGRCQGFYCLATVVGILAKGTGRDPEAILGLMDER
jgi:glycerol-3-phosphate dehydrogenase